ncbi:VOC family protein [Thalassobellus suaedae]|uniref:VOC family protein n=1 Tax=Thalassobellus suaedae TaxID=3074124 RepID=A0ABY9XQ79_9FLAO|nr:VOC family protein [Flavobacteriaceae bacterium HL-DH14]
MKKIILLIIFIPFYSPISAQNNSDFSMNFNHVALSVKDLDESAKFYMNTLNLKEITNKTKKASRRWLSLGEGKELHLISDYNDNVIVNKAVHMALTTSNFDSFIKKLQAMQIKYYDW